MNSDIQGYTYGAVLNPYRVNYKVGQGASQAQREAIVLGTVDDTVYNGSTSTPTDLVLQMPYINMPYNFAGSLSLQLPDGTRKFGNARGMGAVDLQTTRNVASQVASGQYSFTTGRECTASNTYAVAMGMANTASGSYSVALGFNSTASSNVSIALGQGCNVSGANSVAIGTSCTVAGTQAVAIGPNAIASGNYSLAFLVSTASGQYALGMGVASLASGASSVTLGTRGTTNNIAAKLVVGTEFNTNLGEYQMGQLGVGASTTDATPTRLISRVQALSELVQCTLQNNNAMSFTVEITARNLTTGMCGRWEAKGLIKRGANASTTALVGTPTITLTHGDAEAWIAVGAIAITADTTYGALAITVTGAASTNIKWLAKILTTEVA